VNVASAYPDPGYLEQDLPGPENGLLDFAELDPARRNHD